MTDEQILVQDPLVESGDILRPQTVIVVLRQETEKRSIIGEGGMKYLSLPTFIQWGIEKVYEHRAVSLASKHTSDTETQ